MQKFVKCHYLHTLSFAFPVGLNESLNSTLNSFTTSNDRADNNFCTELCQLTSGGSTDAVRHHPGCEDLRRALASHYSIPVKQQPQDKIVQGLDTLVSPADTVASKQANLVSANQAGANPAANPVASPLANPVVSPVVNPVDPGVNSSVVNPPSPAISSTTSSIQLD